MLEDYERQKRKQVSGMKSLMDYGMGILILILGLVFLFRMQFGANHPVNITMGKPDLLEKMFGGLSILYGIWRIYRGYKKNYFR
jgi:hypothetical protein